LRNATQSGRGITRIKVESSRKKDQKKLKDFRTYTQSDNQEKKRSMERERERERNNVHNIDDVVID